MNYEDSCKKTLGNKGLGVKLVSHVADSFPDCRCEKHSASDHSIGPVCEGEYLIHLIMSPIDIDDKNNDKPINK